MRLRGLILSALGAALIASFAADLTSARSDCTAKEARAVFTDFLQAFNRGDGQKLDALFAEDPAFNWYSSSPPGRRLGAAAKTRATLLDYFRDRHRREDRLRLVEFQFTGSWSGNGNFGFEVRRSAADYEGGEWFQVFGKGACTCADKTPKLIVLSLGRPTSLVPRSYQPGQ